MAKETVYIDLEDEITTVIDKVSSAKESVVALVLPKRSPVFQSTVNMKLLKKASKDDKKNIVLITSDKGIEAVAAIAGIHIAGSLTSKPMIPKKKLIEASSILSDEVTGYDNETTEAIEEDGVTASNSEKDSPAKVGVNTEKSASKVVKKDKTEPTIELDNESGDLAAVAAAQEMVGGAELDTPKKGKKKFKVPDFKSFKLRMGLFIAAVLLFVTGWVFGFIILPKATITIEAVTKRVDVTASFTASVDQEEFSLEDGIVPATLVQTTKQDSATVPATGEKDNGKRASGTITLVNCRKESLGVTVPAGTGFSADGVTFSTVATVELGPSVFVGGDTCVSDQSPNPELYGSQKDVGVTANEAGDKYNVSSQSYQSPADGVSAFGSDMTGGTTDLVKVVSDADIKAASEQLSGFSTVEAITDLTKLLSEEGKLALDETLRESDAITQSSKEVDVEASEVTVIKTVTYSMLGVDQEDIIALLDAKITENLEDSTQNVRDSGINEATLQVVSTDGDGVQSIELRTVATIGQLFDATVIKNESAGKKRGEIESSLESRDGVRSVRVDYSPMWVTTTPRNAEKISVQINEVE